MASLQPIGLQGKATPAESPRVHIDPASTPPATFDWLLAAGYWAIATDGKKPLGKAWGLEFWTRARYDRESARAARPGVGICLGPGRGPGGTWLIDVEGDGPEADESRLKLFGGEVVETMGWTSARGSHQVFVADVAKLLAIMPGLAPLEIKGKESRSPGVYKSPELPGLELRIGGYKDDGTIKQAHSAVPPTLGDDGQPRAWTGPFVSAPVPDAFYRTLAGLIVPKGAEPRETIPFATIARTVRVGQDEAWTRAALASELETLSSAGNGDRNNQLNKAAFALGKFVPKYLSRADVESSLRQVAEVLKLDAGEIARTIRSGIEAGMGEPKVRPERNGPHLKVVVPQPATTLSDAEEITGTTDLANAGRLARDHAGTLRYAAQWGKWLRWDGRRWKEDSTGEVYRMAKATIRGIAREAADVADPAGNRELLEWAIESQSRKRIDAMIHLARYDERIVVGTDQLDRDPWLLNVRNGTIDLRTGRLRPHDQNDHITKLADVDFHPSATCPRWDQFLSEIMDGDPAMVEYLRRIAGYGITADVREHCLFFFYGDGRNGKSLFLNTVQDILGDYSTTVNASLLTAKHNDDHPTGLTDLENRRFVATIEVADGKRMAEALVKQLTGGDRIKARRMRQDFYEFAPTHKIVLAANHKPEIRGTDEGIWQRVKLVPFPMTFVEPSKVDPAQKRLPKDKSLDKTLARERPGILAAMVRSCLDWQRDGLAEPAAVIEATASYRADMDDFARFIEERCITAPGNDKVKFKASSLYEAYAGWCKSSGIYAVKARDFGAQMERRGFKISKSNSTVWRLGIGLRADDSRPTIGDRGESDFVPGDAYEPDL